jgi:tetratricopeptide (TPR) repeat protein
MFAGAMTYLQNLEQRYKAAAQVSAGREPDTGVATASVTTLVQAGDALLGEEKYSEAEKKYIAAVAIDPRSLSAYKGLVGIYTTLNDTEHAIATLQFMEQLDPKDETTYRRLAELYCETDKAEEAMDAMEQALALAPNNPKNLDAFIEIAILNKLKYRAQSTLDKLKEVNPDNKKQEKYQEEINAL